MISAPTYDPAMLTGKDFGTNYLSLENNPYKPLINRAIAGTYLRVPPSSLPRDLSSSRKESSVRRAVTPVSGYPPLGGRPACHGHSSPLAIQYALATSCNSFFCYGLNGMLSNRSKYGSVGEAFDIWKDHMVKMGFGYPLGVDLLRRKEALSPIVNFIRMCSKQNGGMHTTSSPYLLGRRDSDNAVADSKFGSTDCKQGLFLHTTCGKEIKGGADEAYTTRHESGISRAHFELTM